MKPRPMSRLISSSTRYSKSHPILPHTQRPPFTISSPAVLSALHCHQWPTNPQNPSSTPRYSYNYNTLRHASTSTATSTTVPAKKPTQNLTPRAQWNPKLNPPHETYAPPIDLPTRSSSQSYPSYLLACGRAYIQFYKTGIKHVRVSARIAKALRQKSASAQQDASTVLTRAEWQTVRRSRKDMLRLPAFATLVLLFGEWLPLLALYITPLIPEPCRIPKQVERDMRKAEEKRRERLRRLGVDAARLVQADRRAGAGSGQATGMMVAPRAVKLEDVDRLDLYTLLGISARLDTHSRVWDWLYVTPPKPLLRWGVGRKLAYLKKDDGLIERDGGWQGLGKEEVLRACVERGVDVLKKNEGELRKGLAEWYAAGKR
ncbi:hypothetical protein BU24DRAFT_421368 [Aaosphaeria arxii CBS 175.79]|uniref:Letm1 RBD domain-containing protein n=1 Tax=Aaosphaeria arxii CBS 175.79 TaxID=1450172 RepID=A0A6A5XYK1_9PLEO|nr:uncharacterized protein BU24DRAFT_421368 [Aaosphaeria arxii CBS 175.79]KAF2018378.1 hypothetical protein BU24DRAFT_421368 [Aaosphaeria arxii CBS 175.79]